MSLTFLVLYSTLNTCQLQHIYKETRINLNTAAPLLPPARFCCVEYSSHHVFLNWRLINFNWDSWSFVILYLKHEYLRSTTTHCSRWMIMCIIGCWLIVLVKTHELRKTQKWGSLPLYVFMDLSTDWFTKTLNTLILIVMLNCVS